MVGARSSSESSKLSPIEGQEALIIDRDEKVRRGLAELLGQAGLPCTGMDDPQRAYELAREKYFAVALVDLDTPSAGAGLAAIGELKRQSAATTIVVMAGRKAFDLALAAYRAGAADVIVKAPDQVDYLRRRVLEAAGSVRRQTSGRRIVGDALAFHDDLIKVLLETYTKLKAQEEKSGVVPVDEVDTSVLLVDDNVMLQGELGAALQFRGGFTLKAASTGGEALDLVGRERVNIALVKDKLPDLPGSMVVKTLKTQLPNVMALLYTEPADRPGSVKVVEGSRMIPFLAEFTSSSQIVERLDELRDAALATTRERRHLAAFRQEYSELLKRYAELKQKLQRSANEK